MTHIFHPSILREYDIRGVAGKTVFEADALHIGRAFAAIAREKINTQPITHPPLLGEGRGGVRGMAESRGEPPLGLPLKRGGDRWPRIVVGMDGRLSSPALQSALVTGLTQAGARVIDIGVGPTPMLYFAVHHLDADGGIMVTGSHNPPDHNGFKFMLGKESFFGEAILGLARRAGAGTHDVPGGGVETLDISDAYIERLLRDVPGIRCQVPGVRNSRHGLTPDTCYPTPGAKRLRVAWDPGNGAAGDIVSRLVQKLSGEHVVINAAVDGHFPAHHPDPSEEKNLEQLIALVKGKTPPPPAGGIPPLPPGEGRGEGRPTPKAAMEPFLRSRIRALRKNATDAEKLLWSILRNRQLGYKFRRQHSINPYITDFCCVESKLIIEIDGGQHAQEPHRQKDQERTQFLERKGYRILRYWNIDVLQNTESVIESVLDTLTPALSQRERGSGPRPSILTPFDLGIAFDGDADRIGVVDAKGRNIYIDQLLLLYIPELVREKQGAIVIADVKASRVFFQEAKKLGADARMCKTGHSHIKYKMKEIGAQIAAEVSGHMFFAHKFYGHDDALYAALRLLNILADPACPPLDVLIDAMPQTVATPDLRIPVAEGRKFAIIEEVRARLVQAGIAFNDVDGMRVEKPEGWWLLRASNTAELVTVRAEASSEKDLAKLRAEVEQQLRLSGVRLEN